VYSVILCEQLYIKIIFPQLILSYVKDCQLMVKLGHKSESIQNTHQPSIATY